jgi:hypothetical protein
MVVGRIASVPDAKSNSARSIGDALFRQQLEDDAAVGDGDAGIELADGDLLTWRRGQRPQIVEAHFAAHVVDDRDRRG